MSQLLQIFWRLLIIVILGGALASCAGIGADVVKHAFAFDLRKDAQNAAVRDYRYGDSKGLVSPPRERVKEGKEFYVTSIGGPMLRGDYLYVKWRDKATGNIYEDRVDLRHRLPRDITGHTVYFMIQRDQLYVYLIPPPDQLRPKDEPPVGPSASKNGKNLPGLSDPFAFFRGTAIGTDRFSSRDSLIAVYPYIHVLLTFTHLLDC